jgi:hypothetical protein
MKMKPEHIKKISLAFDNFFHKYPSTRQAYFNSGLNEKRLRWDVFNAVIPVRWVCDTLYQYLDNTHIDTVLRKITDTK